MTVEIVPDEYAGNPYEEWDNLSRPIILSRKWRYGTGRYDLSECTTWDEVLAAIGRVDGPLAYVGYIHGIDHSGLHLWLTESEEGPDVPDYCWDGGLYGVLVVSRDDVLREYGAARLTPKLRAEAARIAASEFRAFSQWMEGDVWGYQITDDDGELIDSCGGLYGREYAEQEAESAMRAIEARDQTLATV